MKEINCLGEICPVPVIRTQQQLKVAKANESFKVITDHGCTVEEISKFLKKKKVNFNIEEVINGVWEIVVVKL
ncbi:SirA-like protein [Clostridium homopropionicum DSM 5847]|uniref:SirA-like protein n=1 Tax=Clostridium homopropionicum DSM 5847 TaxID=1121318 RepID=A0A0L6Z837_9CLOT|nr:sulfurtransferase TusA family protein [Clostridium homopropionicum]KOA18968.1 SirA-like protein [Clostridium homopropionicum DSM 5847]SFG43145.1 TusA-related sulfurtransferase [Clostridium homopropionicum]